MYRVILSKQAQKDLIKLKSIALSKRAKELSDLVASNPFHIPPRYEKLVGNLSGYYSRRINIQQRFVYEVSEAERTVKILRMRSHYE